MEDPWNQPVIDRGPAGSWNHYAVDNPYVHVEGNRLYCFFEGQDQVFKEGGKECSGLAWSEDGRQWTVSPRNPIVNVGPPGAWDAVVAKLPVGLIRHRGRYHLYYSGRDGRTKQIGLATAERLDGPWQKHPQNPILPSRPAAWDKAISTYPSPIFRREGRFFLLFRGMERLYAKQGLGLATSKDLVSWERVPDSDAQALTPAGVELYSLAAVQEGAGYLGIPQLTPGQARPYYRSTDLRHWNPEGLLRFRASTAPETLSNPFYFRSQWCVLYEQKDRIYRAILKPPR